MKNLAKAVIAVMKEVKGMEKNSTIGGGTYKYQGTKDQDVKEVFNKALSENGLCILPIGIDEETKIFNYTDNYGKQKQSITTKVVTKYLLLHESGESQELAGYGHGIDTADKGAGKATTYALKNCLLYTFLTPVGKIDDTETTHSEDIEAPQVPIEKKELGGVKEAKHYANQGVTLEHMKTIFDLSKVQEEKYSELLEAENAAKKIDNEIE